MKTIIITILLTLAAVAILLLIEFSDHDIDDVLEVEEKQK